MLPKTRLGKRSPLGALVSSMGDNGVTVTTAAAGRVKGHPGLKVYFQCGGAGEPSGVLDQPDLMQSEASARSSSLSSSRSVSSCIDVPRSQRSPEEVDMDELMAAMVLSSLSCSPLLHSPAGPDATAPPMDCGGGELSDGGSSGYWSVGHGNGSPAPSPPITEPAAHSPTTPPDEGLDMELEQVLFDEPAPRKRRNSVKAAYRCLWPSCGKVLTSVVGIKRHIRTTHLCRGGEHERCSRSEEDFYYTEINQWDRPPSPPRPVLGGSASPSSLPPPPPPLPALPSLPPSPPSPACGALSCSAPSSSGSFWQVQSEHSYQAPPPSHVTSAAAPTTASCRWTAPPTSCVRQVSPSNSC
ncbi:Zinc finger protein 395 [Larimichthys crocea]|uniref:Zinc finger protein 395 n=1 Tax=Larimichthys crocea TaxID=215358 RepID=A0A6G0HF93_LARCR|nr:Zinc finger protein 395 [Larimichthys crocea]